MHASVQIRRTHGNWEAHWQIGPDDLLIGIIENLPSLGYVITLSEEFTGPDRNRVHVCRNYSTAKDLAAVLVHNRVFPKKPLTLAPYLAEEKHITTETKP